MKRPGPYYNQTAAGAYRDTQSDLGVSYAGHAGHADYVGHGVQHGGYDDRHVVISKPVQLRARKERVKTKIR